MRSSRCSSASIRFTTGSRSLAKACVSIVQVSAGFSAQSESRWAIEVRVFLVLAE